MLETKDNPVQGKSEKPCGFKGQIAMKKTKNINGFMKKHSTKRSFKRKSEDVIVILLYCPDAPFISTSELIELRSKEITMEGNEETSAYGLDSFGSNQALLAQDPKQLEQLKASCCCETKKLTNGTLTELLGNLADKAINAKITSETILRFQSH